MLLLAAAVTWPIAAWALAVSNVSRLVDLSTAIVSVTELYHLRDLPETTASASAGSAGSAFVFKTALPADLAACCLGAASLTDGFGTLHPLLPVSGGPADVQLFAADIPKEAAEDGRRLPLTVLYQFGKLLAPLPKRTGLKDRQAVLFAEKSPFALSPYEIDQQETSYYLPSNTEVLDVPANAARKRSAKFQKFHFKRTTASKPYSQQPEPVKLRFVAEFPLIEAPQVERRVTLSHFRATSFKDHYRVHNAAAEVDEPFDRWALAELTGGQHRRDRSLAKPHRSLFVQECTLPLTATDIQYFDEIGNISTSRVARRDNAYTALSLEPRFPLFGGWGADWRIEFRTKLTELLSEDYKAAAEPTGRVYVLNIPVTPACHWMFVEKYVFTLSIPHGAEVRAIALPRQLTEKSRAESSETSWFGLGRPRKVFTFTFGAACVTNQTATDPIVLTYVYDPVKSAVKAIANYATLAVAAIFTVLLLFNASGRFLE